MLELSVLDYREDAGVATVLVDSPVNVSMIKDLETICAHLEDTSPCEVVVFDALKGSFADGIDLREFDPRKPLDIHGFHRWEKILTWIERLKKVTIAHIRGDCVGAGFHLALVCDLRLAADNARLGLDEVRRGLLPGMATFRLAKYVGLGRAKQLTLTGKMLDSSQALEWGLLDVVAVENSEAELSSLIESLKPINLVAVELCRRLLNESYAIQYEEAIGNFLAAQHRSITSEAFLSLLNDVRKES